MAVRVAISTLLTVVVPNLLFFGQIASAGLPHFAHPSVSNGGAHTTSPLHPSDADRDCIGVDVDGLSGGHIRSPGRRVGESALAGKRTFTVDLSKLFSRHLHTRPSLLPLWTLGRHDRSQGQCRCPRSKAKTHRMRTLHGCEDEGEPPEPSWTPSFVNTCTISLACSVQHQYPSSLPSAPACEMGGNAHTHASAMRIGCSPPRATPHHTATNYRRSTSSISGETSRMSSSISK